MNKETKKAARLRIRGISSMRWAALSYILNDIYRPTFGPNGNIILVNDVTSISDRICWWKSKKKKNVAPTDELNRNWLTLDDLPEELATKLKKEKEFHPDAMRKALNEYENDGLMIKDPRKIYQHNRKHYYPNETKEGFRKLVELMAEYRKRDEFTKTHTNILHSNFSKLFVNRQLILDILNERGMRFALRDGNKDVELPILGRYRKVFETCADIGVPYSSVLNYTNTFREEVDVQIERWNAKYKNADRNDDAAETYKIAADRFREIDHHLKKIERFVALQMSVCKEFKKAVDEKGSLEEVKIWDRFGYDPFGSFRKESMWEPIYLTDEERARVENIDYKGRKLTAEEYCDEIEKKGIIPILCLIQSSPSALIHFVTGEWTSDFYDGNKEKVLPLREGSDLAKLLWNLFEKTMDDYFKDYTWGTVEFPTTFVYMGNMGIGKENIPSLITFRLDDGRYAVYHGGKSGGFLIPYGLQYNFNEDLSNVGGFINVTIIDKFDRFPVFLDRHTHRLREIRNGSMAKMIELMERHEKTDNADERKRIKEDIKRIRIGWEWRSSGA